MKARLYLPLLTVLFVATPLAAAPEQTAPAQTAADTPLSEGTVKKVDKATGKVTIKHGPLVNLNMPAMTMLFRVNDAAWLDQLKPGDNIRFNVEKVNGSYTVMRYELVK